jgi:hypothetical protein
MSLPRSEGGRGLLDLALLYDKQIQNLRNYFRVIKSSSALHSAVTEADSYTPLKLNNDTYSEISVKLEDKIQCWSQKTIHGRFPNDIRQPNVDKQASLKWLHDGMLFPETEGFLIAIQDQVIATKNYKKYIMKDGTTDDKCRKCGVTNETIQHVVSGCQTLAPTEYKRRHDLVANIVHQEIALKTSLLSSRTPYYKYSPTSVLENREYKIYWDRSILSDRTVVHNRPDITMVDKVNKSVILIDIAVPESRNLQSTYNGKITKYLDLVNIIKEQWRMEKVSIVPVVISATGIVLNTMKVELEELGIENKVCAEMQKATLISTASLVRKFLGATVND